MNKKKCPLIRFEEKYVVQENGCWIWTACKLPSGYGQFWDGEKYVLAHRFSYENRVNKIPVNLVIDHLCRNPSCVNPDHLECVTMGENTARGMLFTVKREKAKAQTHCKRGHPLSGENLITSSRGRSCKECQRQKADEWRRKNIKHVNDMQRERRKKYDMEKLQKYKSMLGIE